MSQELEYVSKKLEYEFASKLSEDKLNPIHLITRINKINEELVSLTQEYNQILTAKDKLRGLNETISENLQIIMKIKEMMIGDNSPEKKEKNEIQPQKSSNPKKSDRISKENVAPNRLQTVGKSSLKNSSSPISNDSPNQICRSNSKFIAITEEEFLKVIFLQLQNFRLIIFSG